MMLLFPAPSCPLTLMPLDPSVVLCPEAFPVSLVLFALPQALVPAQQLSCPALCEAAAQATMARCIALLCDFLGLPVVLFLAGEPLSQ